MHKILNTRFPLIFLLLGLLLFESRVVAQDLKFFPIDASDGLSQSTVNCMLQDQDGYVWIGTDDGLNRYDGLNMKVFRYDQDDPSTISYSGIESLHLDAQQQLWVGTSDGGLNLYQKHTETFKRFQHQPNDPLSFCNNTVYSIVQADAQHIWIGTADGLVWMNTTDHSTITYHDEPEAEHPMPKDGIRTLFLDQDQTLWIGTLLDGLFAYDPTSKTFSEHPYVPASANEDLTFANRIRAIYRDSRGNLWIGKDGGGLNLYQPEAKAYRTYFSSSKDPQSISDKRITAIYEDDGGNLWIGTSKGLNLFNREKETFKTFRAKENDPYSLHGDYIQCIFEDDAHSLWCGTQTNGISLYHSINSKFNHVKRETDAANTLPSNVVMCFSEDRDGWLWIGTYGEGLAAYDPTAKLYYHFPASQNQTNRNILTVTQAVDGKIWFGSWGAGFNAYDKATQSFGTPITTAQGLSDNDVIDLSIDQSGKFWISTFGGGLNQYDPATGAFKVYGTEAGFASTKLFDQELASDGTLWVSSKAGLSHFDPTTEQAKTYTMEDGLSNETINCLFLDKQHRLWIGTKYGLNVLQTSNGKIRSFHERDGLTGEIVYGVLQDEQDNLWVSTTSGLSKMTLEGEGIDGTPVFKNYSNLNGLQDNEFNQNAFYKSPSGELFFGGINGYNHFYGKDITDNLHVPPVALTGFKIYGKEVELDTAIAQKHKIHLSYRDNFFSFDFAALDFISTKNNRYTYKLEGFDEQWSAPSNRPYANYTNVGGGDYVFRVRGANSDGVWNEEGLRLHLVVDPPFWQTAWFLALCIVVGLITVMLVIRLRTAKLKRDKKMLEEKVRQRTEELAEKNRDITSSIEYAKRIQEAILPEKQVIFEQLGDAFILYLPKDIVSGDFYWYANQGDKQIIAAVDCTGHGVPGAFMSMIGHNLLNQIVLEKGITAPGTILEHLNKGVQHALKQGTDAQETNDGMDVALCVIDRADDTLSYAGAYRPLYLVSNDELTKTNGDKYPIGGAHVELDRTFSTHTFNLKKGDSFYIFSDGYADQFGGPKGKKFMAKRLQRLIMEASKVPLRGQQEVFQSALSEWMQDLEQIDDVLVIGVRYE